MNDGGRPIILYPFIKGLASSGKDQLGNKDRRLRSVFEDGSRKVSTDILAPLFIVTIQLSRKINRSSQHSLFVATSRAGRIDRANPV
jgi:hypothetical protein